MAPVHAGCAWLLALGACVSLVLGSDCGKECALCVFRALGERSTVSSMTCSLECEGGLDSQKLRLCQNVLLDEENHIPLDQDPRQEEQEAGVVTADDEAAASPEHQLSKKYGGFMKRYGGFMSRRSLPSPEVVLEDSKNQAEEENIRLEILKLLNSLAEHGGEGGGQEGQATKRYGGFMRRAGGETQGDLLEALLGRGLKKRYGGFMRRVGRPEWLVDNSKLDEVKRDCENCSEVQKRYGGFMD